MIDLRSDTVTKPTPEMRRAMMDAEVGDDVYGEDPTVNRLEQRAAEIAGKEAALFVPTGTMGNTIAIKLLTEHGQEVIADSRAHVLDYELSMVAWFSGCVIRAIQTDDGILSWDQVRRHIKPVSPYSAPTGLRRPSRTPTTCTAAPSTPCATVREICDGAHERGVKVHMDGARIFNAAAALGMPVREIAAPADTVMFCLSKGLGAPAGSMLAGPAALIAKGRLYRKRLGGGMRQVGVLAAAGLVALEQTPKRLFDDHCNAKFLAEGLSRIPGIQIDPARVQTNIAVFDVSGTGSAPAELSARLRERGVLMNAINERQMRAVTHYDVDRAQCAQALEAIADPGGIMRISKNSMHMRQYSPAARERHRSPSRSNIRSPPSPAARPLPRPPPATSTSIGVPRRVTTDSAGNVYFSASNSVFRLASNGTLTLVAGNSRAGFSGDGGPAVNAQLNAPAGPRAGCRRQSLHRRFAEQPRPHGRPRRHHHTPSPATARPASAAAPAATTMAAPPPTPSCTCPMGVAVDKAGNVYIADTGDNIIRKVTTDGIINTIAGDSYPGFFDKEGGTAVRLRIQQALRRRRR